MTQQEIKTFIQENNGSSGKMYNEKFVKNNYPEIYEAILEYSNENLFDLPFKEKVYCYIKNITEKVKCTNPNCNNFVKFKNSTIGYYKYCGISCISSDPKIKEIKEKKSYEKYGTKIPAMSSIVKNKIIKTNNEKYGGNSPLNNQDIIKKSKETLMHNYGVETPLNSKIIQEKTKKTNIERYGVDNPRKNKDVAEKIKQTMLSRYGTEIALHNDEIKKIHKIRLLEELANYVRKIYSNYDILKIDRENKKYTIRCDKGHDFEIDYVLLRSRRKTKTLICTECNPINKGISGLEIEFFQFIQNNYKGDLILNNRGLIDLELDVYIPEFKLAFEFNGTWWHNELNKPEDYHIEKTEQCEKIGIQLIHIWEDDWIHKRNIVESMVLNKMKMSSTKIYARKCRIDEVKDIDIVRTFLEQNHIQGYVNSLIKLGLFYNDELVSLMTFGKKRIVMNDKSNENEWELSRFCNKINCNIVGGASRLFKYFINEYKPKEIVSYANRGYSNGNLYEKLGFDFIHKTRPNYHYVIDKIRKHRFSCRKSELVKLGYDKTKTEHEIMLERKIYRIYDSGNLKFVYKKKED